MIKEDVSLVFDVMKIRSEFPALHQQVNGRDLVYLDNGATSQKPQVVIDAISDFYQSYNANIHRGVHHLSQVATSKYEETREIIRSFINAHHQEEVIFTSGTTEGINLIASSFGDGLSSGDEIVISAMEHHSNIVPWQMLCERKGCKLQVIPMNEKGELVLDSIDKFINDRTKLVAVSHISNSLGTINPVKEIINIAHRVGAKVLLDGAQSIQHTNIDVQDLDCDFFVFSGHKVFGPTGIGVLYGKKDLLDDMPPYKGGGDMIASVTLEKTTYNTLPHKLEAGTPNISGGIALGEAIKYLAQFDIHDLAAHEEKVAKYAESELSKIDGLRLIGTAEEKASVVSFIVDNIHPFDLGTLLDKQGVAVRTGHHCTQPIMDFYQIPGTVRASFAFYNTMEEVDVLVAAVNKALSMLR